MKIGIPNTLFASYHFAYWQEFLRLLNVETVISSDSTKETADRGGKVIPPEFCVPVKVFMGHILDLMHKDVDLILVPKMKSRGNRNFFCPKLMGLTEIVKYAAGLAEERLFSPEMVCNGLHIQMTKLPDQKIAPYPLMKIKELMANRYWEQQLAQCRLRKLTLPEAVNFGKTGNLKSERSGSNRLRIGLIGYAYSLYDPFISKGIINQLAHLGAEVETWEMLASKCIEENLSGLTRPIFWNFGRIIVGAGLYFLQDPTIDGVIYVTTFGCGPDSVAMKILSLEAGKYQKPLLQINLDEHSEDGHLCTRLEAFLDMLAEQKENESLESNLSAHGAGARL